MDSKKTRKIIKSNIKATLGLLGWKWYYFKRSKLVRRFFVIEHEPPPHFPTTTSFWVPEYLLPYLEMDDFGFFKKDHIRIPWYYKLDYENLKFDREWMINWFYTAKASGKETQRMPWYYRPEYQKLKRNKLVDSLAETDIMERQRLLRMG